MAENSRITEIRKRSAHMQAFYQTLSVMERRTASDLDFILAEYDRLRVFEQEERELLAALRECAERVEGCDWCTPEPNERLELRCSRIGHTSYADYGTAGRIDGNARFCPACGRKVEVNHDG